MLKIKNKFIIFIIVLITLIISAGIFSSFLTKKIDRNSYVVLLDGKATISKTDSILVVLKKSDKEKLSIGDTVRTIGENALAILEWGDGSVTRIGGDSVVKIEDLYVSDDKSTINLSFELLNGKTWSNIVSFLGEDSYFKEHFRDTEASVRGTIFNLDLTNDYLNVIDHKVLLTNTDGGTVTVEEHNPINITTFDFIALEKFISDFKDKTWENINTTIDIELFDGLKEQIQENLEELINLEELNIQDIQLDSLDREEIYNKILEDYQKLNFAKSSDGNLFLKKLELKEALIKIADGENKEALIKNTLYDFNDMIDSKNLLNIDSITGILKENEEYISSLQDINQYIKTDLIPEDLKSIFGDNLKNIKGIIDTTIIDTEILNIEGITDKANGAIQDSLDTLFNK